MREQISISRASIRIWKLAYFILNYDYEINISGYGDSPLGNSSGGTSNSQSLVNDEDNSGPEEDSSSGIHFSSLAGTSSGGGPIKRKQRRYRFVHIANKNFWLIIICFLMKRPFNYSHYKRDNIHITCKFNLIWHKQSVIILSYI